MNRSSVTALVRGIIRRAPFAPSVVGVIGVALIITGGIGLFASRPASAEAVSPVSAPILNIPAAASNDASCVRASYALPEQIPLDDARTGLTVIDDGVISYGVRGDTEDDVRDALIMCAPGAADSGSGEFLAYTSYTVNWGYDIKKTTGNTCRLADVKVGLRLNQLMPRLLATGSPDVQAKWDTFSQDLAIHEDGHKALDIDQAKALLSDLQSLTGPCATIDDSAQSLTTRHLQDFITANAEHDEHTDHGADQGATW